MITLNHYLRFSKMTTLLSTVTVTCQEMKHHNMRAVALKILRSVSVPCHHLKTIGHPHSSTWTGYVALKCTFFQLHCICVICLCWFCVQSYLPAKRLKLSSIDEGMPSTRTSSKVPMCTTPESMPCNPVKVCFCKCLQLYLDLTFLLHTL